ncbi:MAG: DNA polymerase I [Candidatus Kapabacteria bacterium]|nr:DNA polymerase I [Candidatus Kapabacteria bacterium]
MSRLYLIDSMSLVFRAYYAMQRGRPLTAPNGEPTGAVFGFANILTSLIEKEKIDYIACVFDTKEPTFRHKMYEPYKANRQAFPEELVPQLARIKELIDLLGIKRIEMPGYEADDIIGTLATEGERKGVDVLCVTSDKDYYQLVDSRVRLLKPSSGADYEQHGEKECYDKFGVEPGKVIDVLALIGDTSDNIPGVKGVGEKSAIPLIQEYGSLEALYENIEKIDKAGLKSKLVENRDMAFLSKELVTIHRTMDIGFGFEECKMNKPDYAALDHLLESLNFRTLRAKFQQKSGVAPNTSTAPPSQAAQEPLADDAEQSAPMRTIRDVEHDYILVDTDAKRAAMIEDLSAASTIAFDLETTSLDAMQCEIVGVALSARKGRAFYIPIPPHTANTSGGGSYTRTIPPAPRVQEMSLFDDEPADEETTHVESHTERHQIQDILPQDIVRLLTNPAINKVGQNAKYDALILKRYGVEVEPITFDSMLASYVLNPDSSHGMDAMAQRWLQYLPVSITTLIGTKKSEQISMRDVEVSRVAEYAAEDADITFQLCELLSEKLLAEPKLDSLARTIEFPVMNVLTQMEFNGVAIDTSKLSDISAHIKEETAAYREKIFKESGGIEFNIDSPKQIGEVLFERMNIPALKKNKTGYSTDASVLSELATDFPIAQYILEYRGLQKLQNTYVEALPRMINPHTGRIHTTYNQTIAGTGRLSSVEPNLQNIPIRTALGRSIRTAFVPQAKDAVIFSADYSQIELRIMAHVCNDETLTNAFINGHDIHKATAANLFGVELNDVTSDMRRIAKTVNFGIMYGQGAFGLAGQLGIPQGEARAIISQYFERYASIKKYMDDTIHHAELHGYVETMMGRRKWYPDITSRNRNIKAAAERAAINMPIQGTAADMMKIAMINLHQAMKHHKFRSLMMLQVHDELVFEVMPGELDDLRSLVKETMEAALPLGRVPVLVETGVGMNWDEAH